MMNFGRLPGSNPWHLSHPSSGGSGQVGFHGAYGLEHDVRDLPHGGSGEPVGARQRVLGIGEHRSDGTYLTELVPARGADVDSGLGRIQRVKGTRNWFSLTQSGSRARSSCTGR